MKIAIDIRSAGGEKTGKGFYTFHMLQALLKIDQENHYTLYTKDGIAGFHHFKNVTIKRFSGRGLIWHFKVIRDLEKTQPDIFWAPSSYIIPALTSNKIKTILTVHDLVAFHFPTRHNKKATIVEKLFLKRALKKANTVLSVSDNTKKDLLDKFNFLEKNNIHTIYCSASEKFKPLDASELKEFAKKTKLPQKFFLAVGTIEPRKNYKKLIQAFKRISDHYPNYHLIVVGKEGWQYEEVYDEICAHYLQKKVHFLGYLSNKSLVSLYNLAQALVFPSIYEGFGIPPLEAMKCGCPVISSQVSSIPEVVGDAAILIDPENEEVIARAMERIICAPKEVIRLREKGILQSKKFSWEKSAKRLLALYTKI
jgi:glycosyltransferase involved in cell wall biosynthesis